jgi:7,8-dihydro-6-hydroxymethylpterin-pyrophosphokinase
MIDTKYLTIPHPRMDQRNFILTPLIEIAPDEIHPGFDKSMKRLFAELKERKIVKIFKNGSFSKKEEYRDA